MGSILVPKLRIREDRIGAGSTKGAGTVARRRKEAETGDHPTGMARGRGPEEDLPGDAEHCRVREEEAGP